MIRPSYVTCHGYVGALESEVAVVGLRRLFKTDVSLFNTLQESCSRQTLAFRYERNVVPKMEPSLYCGDDRTAPTCPQWPYRYSSSPARIVKRGFSCFHTGVPLICPSTTPIRLSRELI